MNGKPTAEQKRFHNWCRERGCVINKSENPSIHHIGGARMKLKGVKGAGDWYVLPVSFFWHQDLSNPDAIHTNKKRFEKRYRPQKSIWMELLCDYKCDFGRLPMSEEEYQIILERG